MYSMTGYGKGVVREGGLEVTVEVKSVNNRFLDLAVKCPRALLSSEEAIRSAVRESVSRGHVDVFVGYCDRREKQKTLFVDMNAAASYVTAAKELGARFPELSNDVTLSFLLRQTDVARPEEVAEEDEALVCAVKSALAAALAQHAAMRKSEGERLKRDLVDRMNTIAALRDKIALRAPLVAEEYRKKLTERMSEYLAGKVEETRILTEAALFCDKCNIDEELTRLQSHIEEFHHICGEARVGRKLDFLVQEFNRECNTICSKSNDKQVTACALEMKNEIEKVREQVQNLE